MKGLKFNFVADGDVYKWTHPSQYPEGLTASQSHGIARIKSKFPIIHNVGMTMILKDYFCNPITASDVEEARLLCENMTGTDQYFNEDIWLRVVDELDGKIPIRIKALPEGVVVPKDTPLFLLEPTVSWFTPCVQWCETVLMHVWLNLAR
jgi:nicotinamide phosphoribosyltransferase